MPDSPPIAPEVIEAAVAAYRRERDQIEYFGATEYIGPGPIEAAIRAADEARGIKLVGQSGMPFDPVRRAIDAALREQEGEQ